MKPSLKSILKTLLPAFGLAVFGMYSIYFAKDAKAAHFSIVHLSDTQYFARFSSTTFDSMTQWIADNAAAENIKMVVHSGDITETSASAEWAVATSSMSRLNDIVPYAMTIGSSHDNVALFKAAFESTLSSSTISGFAESYDGNYTIAQYNFSVDGVDWMVLTVADLQSSAVWDWVEAKLDANPTKRAIIVTHQYLCMDNTLLDTGSNACADIATLGAMNGPQIWARLKSHANVTFVFSGHVLKSGVGFLVSTGDNGNKVYQMLHNPQSRLDSDYSSYIGLLRILTIDPDEHTIVVKSYAPDKDKYMTDERNQFTIANADLGTPVQQGDLNRAPYAGMGMPNYWTDSGGSPSRPYLVKGVPATFDSSRTTDPDNDALTYDWNFGDGTAHASGAAPSHTYTNTGTFTVTLTVTDPENLSDSTSTSVTVLNNSNGTAVFSDNFSSDLTRSEERRV